MQSELELLQHKEAERSSRESTLLHRAPLRDSQCDVGCDPGSCDGCKMSGCDSLGCIGLAYRNQKELIRHVLALLEGNEQGTIFCSLSAVRMYIIMLLRQSYSG